MPESALTFEEQMELAALEAFETTIQLFCGQRPGRAAQIFASFMQPKQHRRLAELREKQMSGQVTFKFAQTPPPKPPGAAKEDAA